MTFQFALRHTKAKCSGAVYTTDYLYRSGFIYFKVPCSETEVSEQIYYYKPVAAAQMLHYTINYVRRKTMAIPTYEECMLPLKISVLQNLKS